MRVQSFKSVRLLEKFLQPVEFSFSVLMIDKIHDNVLNDRRLKVREISETMKISVGCV